MRSGLRNHLVEVLRGGSVISLVGGPQIGKTVLSREIARDLEADDPSNLCNSGPVRPIYLALSTVESGVAAFQELAKLVRVSQSRIGRRGGEPSIRDAHQDLLDECRGIRVSLILDDLDAVRRYVDGGEFLRLLRHHISQPGAEFAGALLVSRRPIRKLEEDIRGISTLDAACHPYVLTPLSAAEIGGHWGLSADDAAAVHEWSLGFPGLADYKCSYGSSVALSNGESDGIREAGLQAQVDYLESLGLLVALTQYLVGPVIRDLPRERSALKRLGFLPSEDGAVNIFAQSDLFVGLIRSLTDDSAVWGIFGQAEKRLREVVDAVMSDAYGISWEDAEASKVVRRVVTAARLIQERDKTRYSARVSWLAYTYPGELWTIIQDQWSIFQDKFAFGDKAYWRFRMEGLASLRAPMAHNRSELMSDAQRALVLSWADELVRALDDSSTG